MAHRELGSEYIDATVINSKGFGGNNASASILAPHVVESMLEKRHGTAALNNYKKRNEKVNEQSIIYDKESIEGVNNTIYKFDHNVLDSDAIEMNSEEMNINDIAPTISLELKNHYADMCD